METTRYPGELQEKANESWNRLQTSKRLKQQVDDEIFTIMQAGGTVTDDLIRVGNTFERNVENEEKLLEDLSIQYGIRPSIIS